MWDIGLDILGTPKTCRVKLSIICAVFFAVSESGVVASMDVEQKIFVNLSCLGRAGPVRLEKGQFTYHRSIT
jgi:hypothetical protein